MVQFLIISSRLQVLCKEVDLIPLPKLRFILVVFMSKFYNAMLGIRDVVADSFV